MMLKNPLRMGTPKPVSRASDMTDTSMVYLYTGTEEGYVAGEWFYHNGVSAWVSGGKYADVNTSALMPLMFADFIVADGSTSTTLNLGQDVSEDQVINFRYYERRGYTITSINTVLGENTESKVAPNLEAKEDSILEGSYTITRDYDSYIFSEGMIFAVPSKSSSKALETVTSPNENDFMIIGSANGTKAISIKDMKKFFGKVCIEYDENGTVVIDTTSL